MHAHLRGLLVNALVGGGADRQVVALDAVELQHLLHGNADRRAAAPHTDQEGGPEAAAHDLHAQRQRITQQRLGGDELLGGQNGFTTTSHRMPTSSTSGSSLYQRSAVEPGSWPPACMRLL